MAVDLNKTSDKPIMVKTSDPNTKGRVIRRRRYFNVSQAIVATRALMDCGRTVESFGYITDPK